MSLKILYFCLKLGLFGDIPGTPDDYDTINNDPIIINSSPVKLGG